MLRETISFATQERLPFGFVTERKTNANFLVSFNSFNIPNTIFMTQQFAAFFNGSEAGVTVTS